MVKGETHILRGFQAVTGADLGPSGTLRLTQMHTIWVQTVLALRWVPARGLKQFVFLLLFSPLSQTHFMTLAD